MIIYVVSHNYSEDDFPENYKMIGVYSSDELAQAAIDLQRTQEGFCEYPDGFTVTPVTLNQTNWGDGFIVTDNHISTETQSTVDL